MLYSIFIIPPEPIFSSLKKVIEDLAKEYGGPVFEPHLTLFGNIDIELSELERKLKQLASGADKLPLKLGEISFSTTYYQNVFVRVLSTSKLMQLNIEGKKLLGMKNDVFMPHISLLYGDQSMDIREKAALKVNLPEISFEAKDFAIIPATENIEQWVPVAKITLSMNH